MNAVPDGSLVLAGDIGGTKTNLAIFRLAKKNGEETLCLEKNQRFSSSSHASLGAILREFSNGVHVDFVCAGFGVPGPVKDGRVKTTNLTWGVDASELGTEFEIPHVELLNDLAANAYGISELQAEDFAVIQPGSPGTEGNRCVVSPGTGLGQAGLFWDGRRHRVWGCEGGHSDFAPRGEVQIALLEFLQQQFGHVSAERVVSGMGIQNIYKFLRDTNRGKELPEVREQMLKQDPGKVISEFAANARCPMCAETIEIFLSAFGAEAGNMALKTMAFGGVFLGGGIPAKMLQQLKGVGFLHSFNDKGRMQVLMESIPVKVVLNDQAALLGAARFALDRMLGI